MAQYRLDGNPAILETAAPDGTYRHPGGESGTWNGFAVPNATYRELNAYADASLAAGIREVIRPQLIEGTTLLIHFPCDGDCTRPESGDFWELGDGEHAHHDESYEWQVTGEDDPVYVDGLIWDRVEEGEES